MAKTPGERGPARQTGRKEGGDSFTELTSSHLETEGLVAVAVAAASLWLGAYRVNRHER